MQQKCTESREEKSTILRDEETNMDDNINYSIDCEKEDAVDGDKKCFISGDSEEIIDDGKEDCGGESGCQLDSTDGSMKNKLQCSACDRIFKKSCGLKSHQRHKHTNDIFKSKANVVKITAAVPEVLLQTAKSSSAKPFSPYDKTPPLVIYMDAGKNDELTIEAIVSMSQNDREDTFGLDFNEEIDLKTGAEQTNGDKEYVPNSLEFLFNNTPDSSEVGSTSIINVTCKPPRNDDKEVTSDLSIRLLSVTDIKPKLQPSREAAKNIGELVKNIRINIAKMSSPIKWTVLNSGSQFEKTKVI